MPAEDCVIIRNPPEIGAEVNERCREPISVITVERCLGKAGLRRGAVVRNPYERNKTSGSCMSEYTFTRIGLLNIGKTCCGLTRRSSKFTSHAAQCPTSELYRPSNTERER
ncbi:hypothetical protein Trydic_g8154 [Trypoxylus dichotomus]